MPRFSLLIKCQASWVLNIYKKFWSDGSVTSWSSNSVLMLKPEFNFNLVQMNLFCYFCSAFCKGRRGKCSLEKKKNCVAWYGGCGEHNSTKGLKNALLHPSLISWVCLSHVSFWIFSCPVGRWKQKALLRNHLAMRLVFALIPLLVRFFS